MINKIHILLIPYSISFPFIIISKWSISCKQEIFGNWLSISHHSVYWAKWNNLMNSLYNIVKNLVPEAYNSGSLNWLIVFVYIVMINFNDFVLNNNARPLRKSKHILQLT